MTEEIKQKEEDLKLLPDTFPDMTDIGLGPWSVSKLKCIQNCSLQFYLRYIVKLKVPPPPMNEDRARTSLGSAAHAILEYIAKGHTVEDAFNIVQETSKNYLPEEYWPLIEKENRYNIEMFWTRIQEFKARHDVKKIYPELKLGMTKDFKKTSFFADDVYFRGVVDIALELNNGDALIIDHKRGPDPAWGLRAYEFQLSSYIPLFHYGYKNINGAQTGVHFINHGEILLNKYQTSEKVAEKNAKELVFYAEAAAEAVEEKGGFMHKRGNMCKYCDYQEMCKAGKRGTSGDLEKYASASKQLINITEI